jgi:predicted ABC-type ATPase
VWLLSVRCGSGSRPKKRRLNGRRPVSLPTFTVVAGANGAGKSTLTRLGREGFQDSAILDPDVIARSMQEIGDESSSAIDAGRMVLRLSENLLAGRQSFLVETTLSGNTYLRMMRRAKEAGYSVVLLYVGTSDVAINIQRVRQRVANGGHDVPETDQRRRYPRSFANLKPAFGLADEAVLYDNSTAAGHVEVVVKGKKGIHFFDPLPVWAKAVGE